MPQDHMDPFPEASHRNSHLEILKAFFQTHKALSFKYSPLDLFQDTWSNRTLNASYIVIYFHY